MNFWSRERKFNLSWRRIRVIRVRVKSVNGVKMTDKWGEIQGNSDLVRVIRVPTVYTFMSSVIQIAF